MNLDALRDIAFSRMLQLSDGEENAELFTTADLEQLSPGERELAFQMAARRLAFQLLYLRDADKLADEASVKDALKHVEGLGPIAGERIAEIVHGAFDAREAADKEFAELAPEWPTHRLAAVDRAILRLAHHELALKQTPGRVVVNEAVELAKHYSTEKSPSFINGLLDKVLNRDGGRA
ncbi:MAG: transcription antitermination factor NusB [Phycisphaerales bacterium]|jgi:N utilization substance protein B